MFEDSPTAALLSNILPSTYLRKWAHKGFQNCVWPSGGHCAGPTDFLPKTGRGPWGRKKEMTVWTDKYKVPTLLTLRQKENKIHHLRAWQRKLYFEDKLHAVLETHMIWPSFESEEMNSVFRKPLDSSWWEEERSRRSNGNSPKIPILSSHPFQSKSLSKLSRKCSDVNNLSLPTFSDYPVESEFTQWELGASFSLCSSLTHSWN